jgi:hypothetical protein
LPHPNNSSIPSPAADTSIQLPQLRILENPNVYGSLYGTRILIAVAAFDFSQIPHLEEVIDAYQGESMIRYHIHFSIKVL